MASMPTQIDVQIRLKPTNKPADKVVVRIGTGQFIVSALDVVNAIIEQSRNGNGAALPAVASVTAAVPALPKIGAEWLGGVYSGLTVFGEQAAALVLLPGDEKMKWDDAIAWAGKQGGTLPSRIDHLVLFKNLKSKFKEEAYWSAEQHASDASYAWYQHFLNGNQLNFHQGYELRARAVRRLVIE